MEEKIYTINLRKELLKTPRWKKTKKASIVIKNFLKRHMKSEEIKMGKDITEKLWERGDQKPPKSIRIKATKDEEGKVEAVLWQEST